MLGTINQPPALVMDDFDVAYSLENEQQFWDGQKRSVPA